MKLIKVTCEVRCKERNKILSGYESIYRDILKKEPEDLNKWIVPGLRIEDADKKRIILVEPTRLVIDIEQPANEGFCRDSVLQFMKSVQERVGIPRIARYGLRSTWVSEFKGKFEDLLEIYKKRAYANSPLVADSNDIAIVFDKYNEQYKYSVNSGPMVPDQLKGQFLVYKIENISPVFAYISVDVGDIKTEEFSLQYMRTFFDLAMGEGSKLSKYVSDYLEVEK